MFAHNKRLMYTVRVSEPNPTLGSLMLEQFGGPQGELAAAMRYFSQAIGETDGKRKDMLFDIATEEMSHLEVIGNIIVMLNKNVKGEMAEGGQEAELLRTVTEGGESHVTALLYGGGAGLMNSGGALWSGGYVDTIGEPTADLRSNIAAEARAKVIYERLINVTPDAGVKDALGFLMTREIAHQKSFEKALYSIQGHFPPGKRPGDPKFESKYYNLSEGEGDARGPWNEGKEWEYVDGGGQKSAVDGGDGSASVKMSTQAEKLLAAESRRTMSNTSIDPRTGAELGSRSPKA